MVQRSRAEMTIRRMRIACWKLRLQTQTHTHTEYVIFTAFSLQKRLRARASQCYVISVLPVLLKTAESEIA